jgi:hypothetical protein
MGRVRFRIRSVIPPRTAESQSRSSGHRRPQLAQVTSSLSIGVPARGENATLLPCLQALRAAVLRLGSTIQVETLVCLNGPPDGSDDTITKVLRDPAYHPLNLRLLHSPEGKISAEAEIHKQRQLHGYLCFLDADCKVDPNCFAALVRAMETNPSVQVAYAKGSPLRHPRRTLIERLQSIHYRNSDLLTERRYLHGRCFIQRQWFLPEFNPRQPPVRDRIAVCTRRLRTLLQLELGPLVDDIYLSRLLTYQYGPGAIMEVPGARVRYTAPRSLHDVFFARRRVLLENRRLDILFPELAHLQPLYFNRSTNLPAYNRLRLRHRAHYRLYCSVLRLIDLTVCMQIRLAQHGLFQVAETWVPLGTTKALR